MSKNKLTVTRHGNDVRITLPNGVEFMFHSGDPWAIVSENIARKAMLCLFDRIAALEAEKAERERQEPVAEVGAHLSSSVSDLAPSVIWKQKPIPGQPLYAHPLSLRDDGNPITFVGWLGPRGIFMEDEIYQAWKEHRKDPSAEQYRRVFAAEGGRTP